MKGTLKNTLSPFCAALLGTGSARLSSLDALRPAKGGRASGGPMGCPSTAGTCLI